MARKPMTITVPKTGNRRVVSLWFPSFATDRLARRYGHEQRRALPQGKAGVALGYLPEKPLATVHLIRGGHRLAAINNMAARAGLFPGLPLADARARVPDLETTPSDEESDRRALEKLAFWAGRYTPWTAVDNSVAGPSEVGTEATSPSHGLWLDISGCAHLFGGEEALLTDLTDRLAVAGYIVRAGLADTPGTAWALARFGVTSNHVAAGKPFQILAQGDHRAALAALPVQGLRLDADTVEALTRLGLNRIGDLYPLARADLARRFGLLPATRLDQALGDRDEPLSPLQPPPLFQVRLKFPEPIGLIDDIQAALGRLLPALSERLARAGQGARRLDFILYRVDGTAVMARVGTSRPERAPAHLSRLFREKLADLDPGFGVETALLAARAVESMAATQDDLGAALPEASISRAENGYDDDNGDGNSADLDQLIDRLVNRLGPDRVVGLGAQASHLPERAQSLYFLAHGQPDTGVKNNIEADDSASESIHAPTAIRPVYLLPVPEPVDVLSPGPRDPPVLMRWRGRQHCLIHAEGPERIAPEWWRDLMLSQQGDDQEDEMNRGQTPEFRDYYRVEDEAGERFWLYRQEGLLASARVSVQGGFDPSFMGQGRPGQPPKWYLHGLFS